MKILFCSIVGPYVLFLFRQEKYQKNATKGALGANAPPLETPAASPQLPQKDEHNITNCFALTFKQKVGTLFA